MFLCYVINESLARVVPSMDAITEAAVVVKARVPFVGILGNSWFGNVLFCLNAVVFALGAQAHPQNGTAGLSFCPTSFDEMTLLYSRFLRFIAILPFENRDYTFSITQILLVYNLVASCINWSMFLCYVINKGTPAIDTICETVVVVGVNARLYLLLWHRREIADLLAEGRDIWKGCDADGRRAVRRFERKVRVLFLTILGNSLSTHFLYSLGAAVFTMQARAHPHNDSSTSDSFLPYKWYADDNEHFWPGFEFNFALQVVMITGVSTMASTVDSTAPLLIMLGAGYFRNLRERLLRSCDSDVDDSRDDRELFRLHQRILSYCARIDGITRIVFFTQLLTTVYNMSLAGIKLSGTDPDKYKFITFVLFNLAQLFICQWAPDHLLDESKEIATAAYFASSSWLKRRKGNWMVLMIARAQRPVQMTAAGLFHLSLENFGAMLKGALSFFTVLRNFNV